MKVVVKLFTFMAEEAGAGWVNLELPEGATVADAVAALRERFPHMRWPGGVGAGLMVAVNQEYADVIRKLADGDEVAIIPPVSGGSCLNSCLKKGGNGDQ